MTAESLFFNRRLLHLKSNTLSYSRSYDAVFILPALILFVFVVLFPFVQGIPIALTSWNGFGPDKPFVGLVNFRHVFRDTKLLGAIGNTLTFTFFHTLLANGIGLFLALFLKKTNKGNNFVRTIVFLPFVLSVVLSAIMWTYIYSNVIYRYFGIPTPLGNRSLVMLGLAFIAVWRDSGYCMIIFIAALQGVPKSYYEASMIEGAGAVRRFFHVTVPLIIPAFTANVTLLLSWGFKMFDYSMVATGGGPGRSSETVAMIVYKNIFEYYKAGYGQALSIVMTIVIFTVTAFFAAVMRKKEVEL